MSESVMMFCFGANVMFLAFNIYLRFQKKSESKKIDVAYFDHVEDIVGFFRDKKVVKITAQIMVDGVPVGGQTAVATKSFEEVDYDKIREFKNEIVNPLSNAGKQAILAYYGGPAALLASMGLPEDIEIIKKKSG